MYKGKRFLALIPARSGSKGLKDKNIRLLAGKPLLAYAINAAADTGVMDAIVVSTDSRRYAGIAMEYGAEAPFLRPPELSADTTLASEYIIHAIETLKAAGREYDYFVLLQPTSPLRTAGHILEGVHLAANENLDGVVAFSPADHPPEYYHPLPDNLRLGGIGIREANRQEFSPCYRVNGMLYIANCETFIKTRSFYGENSKAVIIENRFAVDIDCEYDFLLAEFLMNRSENT